MKRIMFSVLVAMLAVVNLTAQDTPAPKKTDTYEQLWKLYNENNSNSLPKSACEVADVIAEKAKDDQNFSQLVKAMKASAEQRMDISTDSILPDVERFEGMLSSATVTRAADAPARKAVLHALLASIYKSVLNSSLSRSDEEQVKLCKERIRMHIEASLDNKPLLATLDATPFSELYLKGEDSHLYDNDVLSLLLFYTENTYLFNECGNHPQEEMLEHYKQALKVYQDAGRRNAAVAMQIRVWQRMSMDQRKSMRLSAQEHKANLKALYEANTDIEAGGDAAMAYYKKRSFSDKREELEFCRYVQRTWPETKVAKTFATYEKRCFDKSVRVRVEGYLVADRPFNIYVSHRNVREVTVTVRDKSRHNSVVRTVISKDFTDSPDYVEDTKTDTIMMTLKPGRYTVTAESEKLSETTDEIAVSSLKLMTTYLPEKGKVLTVVNALTGIPVSGCEVCAIYEEYVKGKTRTDRATFYTDSHGQVILGDEKWEKAYAQRDKNDVSNEVTFVTGNNWRSTPDTDPQYEVFTDRAIYRPGQKILATGYVYTQRGDTLSTMADKSVDVWLRDANWQVVGEKLKVKTDEFGMAAAEFLIPKDRLNGTYSVMFGDARANVRVEEYKRPTFEVTFEKQEGTLSFGDTVTVTGVAKTYYGVPVQDAKVKIEVKRKVGSFWDYWSGSGNWDSYDTQEAVTDEEGKFKVTVFLDGDRAEDESLDDWIIIFSEVMRYRVNASVTDLAGETHEQTTMLNVSVRDYNLRVGGKSNIDRENISPFSVSAVNAEGQKVRVEGRWLLKKARRDTKGGITYVETGIEGSFDTDKPLEIDGLKILELGAYRLVVKSEDSKGNSYYKSTDFVLFSRRGGEIILIEDWIYTDADVIEAGKGVDIYYALAKENPYVFLYVVTDNHIERQQIGLSDNNIHSLHLDYNESFRDGVTFFLEYVNNDRVHSLRKSLKFETPDKKLNIKWKTFRDKLRPGQDETWTLSVTDKDGKPVSAQMLAAMYDGSLDALAPHRWGFNVYFPRYAPSVSSGSSTSGSYGESVRLGFDEADVINFNRIYNRLEPFEWEGNYRIYATGIGRSRKVRGRARSRSNSFAEATPMMVAEAADEDGAVAEDAVELHEVVAFTSKSQESDEDTTPAPDVQIRSDFAETAFCFPSLVTDTDGIVTLSFKLPESLTKWNFMGFAHTKAMDYGLITASAVARKDFMVQPNMPRFVRTGDHMTLTARIVNQADHNVSGNAVMRLIDPSTDKVVCSQERPFEVGIEKTTSVTFEYDVTDEYDMLVCEVTAVGGTGAKEDGLFSDGERNYLPVLSDKKFITETVPFYIQGEGTKEVDISSLFNNNSPTAVKRTMTFEYTDNPSWNVILALHGVMNPKNDNAIDWATSLYVNSVARHLAKRMPKLQALIRQWENESGTETTMQSELEKNQELKDILLQESPWMLDAQDETEQRHKLTELFSQNLMEERINKAKEKLKDLQVGDGWTWFKGMKPTYYTTFAVCNSLTMLHRYFKSVGETLDGDIERMMKKGLDFLDKEELDYYRKYVAKKKHILPSNSTLHYMYMSAVSERKPSGSVNKMFDDYLGRIKGHVRNFTMYGKANCAVTLQAFGRDKDSKAFVSSLREYTVEKPGMGRYFDTEKAEYSWFDYRIPTHVAAMRAMMMSKASYADSDSYLNDMQIWLLRQKQTQKWDNVINTINAVDILLTVSPDTTFHDAVQPDVTVGSTALELTKPTAGVGYSKTPVSEQLVQDVMSGGKPTVTVTKHSPGISWGCVYGRSFERLDNVGEDGNELRVTRKMYVADINAPDGWKAVDDGYVFAVGDKVRMRHVISADRDMDFVQVRSQHAACLEPVKSRSGYQMLGGRGGYLSLHDASADFFFDCFYKGTATIDLELYVTSAGSYSNGIATVQCAYSPSYSGHSAGNRLNVK